MQSMANQVQAAPSWTTFTLSEICNFTHTNFLLFLTAVEVWKGKATERTPLLDFQVAGNRCTRVTSEVLLLANILENKGILRLRVKHFS